MKFTDKGVPILRDDEIEEIAYRLLRKVEPDCIDNPAMTPIPSIIRYLQDNHGLVLSISETLGYINGRKIRGKTILSQGIIVLDAEIVANDESLYFMTAAHEIGHWALHRSRKIIKDDSEDIIDCFEDEEYCFWDKDEMNAIRKKKELRTSIDRLEHQSKVFAANLLMPRKAFSKAILAIQYHLGISRNLGKVGLYDKSELNEDYRRVIMMMQDVFKVSKQAVSIRFKELGLLNDYRGGIPKQDKEAIRAASLRRARE
jgi:Zn-dependent peptidase ImmA (M78 family)